MEKPVVAGTMPIKVDVKAGQTYSWCTCGRSATQPFCDGSHEGTGYEPLDYTPDVDGPVAFCLCKRTSSPPICDGTHLILDETKP